MPERELHLIGGSSGSGKSSWLIKMLERLERGESIYGHAAKPTPYVYVSSDRSRAGMYRTIERLGIDRARFPLYIPTNTALNLTARQIVIDAKKKFPVAKLVVFEGIATHVPDGKLSDYKIVAKFLRELGALCEELDITILGVVHSPKVKEKDKYANPRERIMGSTAWGAYSELIMFLEPLNPDGASSLRTFWILPRNAREEKFTLDFKDGLLVPVNVKQGASVPPSNWERVSNVLNALPVGAQITKKELQDLTGLPDSSIRREIDKAHTLNILTPYPNRPAGTYLRQDPHKRGVKLQNARETESDPTELPVPQGPEEDPLPN